jgi:hypothetical protein
MKETAKMPQLKHNAMKLYTKSAVKVTHILHLSNMYCESVAYRGGFKPPLKFQSFDKAVSNSQFCGKYIHKQPNKNTGFTHLQIEQNHWLGATAPRSPFFLPTVLNCSC